MSIEEFETIAVTLGVGSLILYMVFIMFKLAQESNAGKFGTFVVFFSLGLGIFGFVAKTVIVELMHI